MGNPQYNRRWAIIFGEKDSVGKKYQSIRVSFRIEKKSGPEPNKGFFHIYNLNSESRSEVERAEIVQFACGYVGSSDGDNLGIVGGSGKELQTAFVGDIYYSYSIRKGSNWITTIEAGDGWNAWNNEQINKSFGKNTSIDEVIVALTEKLKAAGLSIASDFAAQVALATKMRSNEDDEGQFYPRLYLSGFSAFGKVSTVLTKLCKRLGLVWEIRDRTVYIYQRGLFLADELILLNPNSGLIESPFYKQDGGVNFSCELNPAINPGRQLALNSNNVSGIQIPQSVTHTGDTHGQQWTTAIEATPILELVV